MNTDPLKRSLQAFFTKASPYAQRCLRPFFSLYLTLLLIRLITFFYIGGIHYTPDIWGQLPMGLHQDLKAAFLLILILSPIAVIFHKGIGRNLLLHTPIVVLLLLHTVLVLYFTTLLQPLDRSILRHSLEELLTVLQEFGAFHLTHLSILLPPLFYIVLFRSLPSESRINSKWCLPVILVLLSFAFFNGFSTASPGNFKDQQGYYLSSNKSIYFFSSILSDPSNRSGEGMIAQEAIAHYQEMEPEKEFVSERYPLLHRPSNGSSLAPFFDLKEERPPNFVFLIIESLSGAFTGEEAHEQSFTPFLDSLAKESLYFPNFLSVGERTFSVLPAAFGSLPHGEKGFINTGERMPRHHTLQSLLGPKGYEGAFFYGGDAGYSNYRSFMERQGVEAIYDQANLAPSKKRNPDGEPPSKVNDAELFRSAHQILKRKNNVGEPPYIHTYLTITMHYPFVFEGQERYIEEFDSILQRDVPEPKKRKEYRRSKKALSAMLYTDDAIRSFMEEYRKRREYENTIFFIFGDHRLARVQYRHGLDRYHVPLIVHSPLLKRSKKCPPINTHFDLPPTILALLRENHDMVLPDRIPWLGSDLDTLSRFRSKRNCLFMLNSAMIEQSLHQEHFLGPREGYRIANDLELKPLEDEKKMGVMRREARVRRSVGAYAVNRDRILPPKTE